MNNILQLIRTRQDRRETDKNLWILPYANLMTVLMILFLILYAFSNFSNKIKYEKMLLEIEKSLGTNITKKTEIVNVADKIESYLVKAGLQDTANVEINAQRIKITMAAPILFSVGSAELNKSIYPLLDEIVKMLKDLPNKITIEGHTCNLPVTSNCKYKSNLELSGARAFSVVQYMIEMGKLNPERFIALGCGENAALKSNDSNENRALNRRVEISIEKE